MAMRSVSAAIDRALGTRAPCFSRGSPILNRRASCCVRDKATLLRRGLSIDLLG